MDIRLGSVSASLLDPDCCLIFFDKVIIFPSTDYKQNIEIASINSIKIRSPENFKLSKIFIQTTLGLYRFHQSHLSQSISVSLFMVILIKIQKKLLTPLEKGTNIKSLKMTL